MAKLVPLIRAAFQELDEDKSGFVTIDEVLEAPDEVAPYLTGAPLTALRKEDKSDRLKVRPIAVGETLRRLVGKCLMRHEDVSSCLRELFLPDQMAMAEVVQH